MDKKQEFLKKLLATFKIEAEENINIISSSLIELEKGCTSKRREEIIEVIFRITHSLKGASRAVNLTEMELICHGLEDVIISLRSNKIKLNSQIFNLLNQSIDLLHEILFINNGIISSKLNLEIINHVENLSLVEVGLKIDLFENPNLKKHITELSKESTVEKTISLKPNFQKESTFETIRVSTKKLDHLLVQTEEMLTLKLNSTQRTINLSKTSKKIKIWDKEVSIILESTINLKQRLTNREKDSTLSNEDKDIKKLLQFQDWTNSYIKEIEGEIKEILNNSQDEEYSSGIKIDILLNGMNEIISVPFSKLLDGFPKMIRNISKDLDKKIDFIVEGDSIKINKKTLENLKIPLMHILRNCIDYGIEKPAHRLKNKKLETGKIILKIEQLENNMIQILISDDGKGLNRKKLKKIYIEKENIPLNDIDNINESDYLNYIFKPGISTSDIITDISGRGLGLAIVQETIEKSNGTVFVKSIEGISTTFHIIIPNTTSTLNGVVVESGSRLYIVPTSKIKKVLLLNKNEIKIIENRNTISYLGEIIPMVDLNSILKISSSKEVSENIQILILMIKNKKFGLAVDSIIEEQEVLVKNFNKQLTRVKYISSASVFSSGKIVPILNVSDLFKSILKINEQDISPINVQNSENVTQKSILIVEDSITSRTLLKNILEGAGYHVKTAIDGIDGFTKLKEGNYDAVISDIEMPRMNGFDLTAKIRADKKYSTIPVLLISSLSKREHKERGIDVGANAYIVKSNFDQNNLLEIVDRLI